jgi:hypothetical protein
MITLTLVRERREVKKLILGLVSLGCLGGILLFMRPVSGTPSRPIFGVGAIDQSAVNPEFGKLSYAGKHVEFESQDSRLVVVMPKWDHVHGNAERSTILKLYYKGTAISTARLYRYLPSACAVWDNGTASAVISANDGYLYSFSSKGLTKISNNRGQEKHFLTSISGNSASDFFAVSNNTIIYRFRDGNPTIYRELPDWQLQYISAKNGNHVICGTYYPPNGNPESACTNN